jgi:hypothetical protein
MRFASLLPLFVLGAAAQAQTPGDELGVRYWYSESKTTRSHNAQDLVPSLGNPTSVLTYEDLKAHALELHGRKNLVHGGYIKGNVGFGDIKSGSFDDEDFNAGQAKFSDTTSTVKGNTLTYFTFDAGGDLWRFRNGTAGLFVGFSYWSERLDAYGLVVTVPRPAPPDNGRRFPDSVPVISNEVSWQALRVGFAGTWQLGAPTRVVLDAALVPYAKVRDEDSHWLRQGQNDLGPAPNIHIRGEGYGLQLDLELRHAIQNAWELGAGLRYWWLRSTDGTRTAAGISVPLSELESQRFGLLLSLTHRW